MVPKNSGGFDSRDAGEVRPASVAEIQALLRSAGDTRYYPVSTGYNWGLGSATPVEAGCTILRTDALDRIRRLDVETGYAVVEPGVTQGQMAERLAGSPYLLNCTASSQHTSIVGNALERGIGVRRPRTDDLLGLEVVLADGSILHTGFWPGESNLAPYRFPMGPSTLHLFTQANFGVVTAAVIGLLPRQESSSCVRVRFPNEVFAEVVDAMLEGRRKGLFAGVAKLYSAVSRQSYGGRPVEQFTACMLVEGAKVVADSTLEVVGELFSGLDVAILDLEARDSEPAEKSLLRSYAGDPTSNDAMIDALFGVPAAEVDTAVSDGGWLFFLPLIPGTRADLEKARSLISYTSEAFGLPIGYTVNLLPEGQIDLVVSLQFHRHQQPDQAHAALRHLHESFASQGYAPYRTDIGNMPHHDDANAKLIASIKHLLDVRRTIAPGRYVR